MTSAAPFPTHVVPPSEPHDAQASAFTAVSPQSISQPATSPDLVNSISAEPIATPQPSGSAPPNETPLPDLKIDMNVEVDDSIALQEEMVIEGLDAMTETKPEDWEGTMEGRVSETSRNELAPSSPPTRDLSMESTRQSHPHEEKAKVIEGGDWDPLRHGRMDYKEADQTQDVTMVAVEGDVVDANGRLLFPESEGKPSPSVSRRGSNLHLDLKPPPSPQPWDLIEPPTANGNRSTDIYSTLESRKFNTLQSNPNTRPLIPKSSYYFGPPPSDAAYGTHPIGQIGAHHPREILRVERDYTGGELIQFAPIYPLELEGRITPTQFLESINSINELLISAFSVPYSFFDNMLAVFTLQLSKLVVSSHYEKEMQRLQYLIDDLNSSLYNPVGLNILWPRKVAFLYLEIEYY